MSEEENQEFKIVELTVIETPDLEPPFRVEAKGVISQTFYSEAEATLYRTKKLGGDDERYKIAPVTHHAKSS